MEKHSVSRLSYLFAHLHLLSSDSFSSTLLSSDLSLLSASSLLCFSSVHIVGSLTSKLPSKIEVGNAGNAFWFTIQNDRKHRHQMVRSVLVQILTSLYLDILEVPRLSLVDPLLQCSAVLVKPHPHRAP